jgi:hypothetical protein
MEIECPNCGGAGSVPKEKVNTRLLCRKCHMPFYITPLGRTVAGDPPVTPGKHDTGPRGHEHVKYGAAVKEKDTAELIFDTGKLPLLIGVIVVGALALGWMYMGGGTEGLTDKAKAAADALASGKVGYLTSIATPGTEQDVSRWYGVVAPQIDQLKKGAGSLGLLFTTLVIEENDRTRTGQVMLFCAPQKPLDRNARIASDAGIKTRTSLEFQTYWKKDSSGKWRLDGQRLELPSVGAGR